MSPPRGAAKIPSPCTIGGLLELLTRPWTLHILWVLSHNGEMRFGVLRRQVEGISARVLTDRLRMLEGAGFVFRHYEQTIPPSGHLRHHRSHEGHREGFSSTRRAIAKVAW